MKYLLLIAGLISSFAYADQRKLQDGDFQSAAQIVGAGGAVSQLLNSAKMYNSVDAEVMDTSIARWNAKQSAITTSSAPANQFATGFTSPNTFTYAQPAFSNISGTASLTTQVTGLLPLANGGTNANLTAALGAMPYSTASAFAFLAPGTSGQVLTSGGGAAPTWTTPTTGTVTAVSVATANGFAGSSSGGATPSLTIQATPTGILKSNGTAISAATVGTDYAAATSGSTVLLGNGAGGFSNYTGASCTNQALTALSTAAAATCTTITSAYVNNSIALTGVDINTSNQVTATHLASALPIAQGGTNQTAFTAPSGNLAGLVYFSGGALTNDATVSDIGYDTSTNTLKVLNANVSSLTTSELVATDASKNLVSVTALPNGTTATTQSAADNSTKVATTAYADRMLPLAGGTMTGQLVVKGVTETVVAAGTCSTSYNIDPTAGTMINLTLNGACQIGVTSLAAGHSFIIKLTQSSTTAPTFTAAYKWTAATQPTWSTSATKYDYIACASLDGTTLGCTGIVDVR